MADFQDNIQSNLKIDAKSAINELGLLEMEAKNLNAELKFAKKNTEEYKQANEKLGATKNKIDELRKQLGLNGMTLRQLINLQRELNMQIGNVTKGTEAYKKLTAQLQAVNNQISVQRMQMRGLDGFWSKMQKNFQAFGAMALGSIVGDLAIKGFDLLFSSISKSITASAELSDELANMRKALGATNAEVKAINASFTKLDTRTSTKDLRQMAVIAGQMGIAKDQVVAFVAAMDKANVALGDEFKGGAEEVSRELGSLIAVFSETKNASPDKAINAVGSAINDLGAAGLATGPVLAEFGKRLGALGNLSPSISQTLGLGAALQELGLSAEIASGGVSNILITASQNLNLYNKSFRDLINTNPNEFLLKLAESFKNMTPQQVGEALKTLKINSQEAIKVMSLLASNTDMVRQKQELAANSMEKSTSLTNEFNIKNNTLAANLEKLGKEFNALFVMTGKESFLNNLVQFARDAIRYLKSLIDASQPVLNVFEKLGGLIANLFNELFMLGKQLGLFNSEADIAAAVMKVWAGVLENSYRFVSLLIEGLTKLVNLVRWATVGVQGMANAFVLLSDFIKNSLIDTLGGLGDIIQGIFTFDTQKIKEGLEKSKAPILQYFKEWQADLRKSAAEAGLIEVKPIDVFAPAKAKGGMSGTQRNNSAPTLPYDPTALADEKAAAKAKADAEKQAAEIEKRWKELNNRLLDVSQNNAKKRVEITQQVNNLTLSEQEREIEQIKRHYEELLNLAKAFGLDVSAIEEARNNDLAAIDTKYQKQRLERNKAYKERQIAEEKKLFDAKMQLLSDFNSLFAATQEFIAVTGIEAHGFAKALGLAQIAIDTAISISKAIAGATTAAAAGGPAAPFLLVGYIASMVGSVLTAFTSANKLINNSEAPEAPNVPKPSFFYGGDTGTQSIGRDKYGAVAGYVHTNEYVIPAWKRSMPMVARMEQAIEAVGSNKAAAMTQPDKRVDMMLAKLDKLIEVTAQEKKRPAYVSFDEFTTTQEIKSDLESKRTL